MPEKRSFIAAWSSFCEASSRNFTRFSNGAFSFFIFLTIVALMIYTAHIIFNMFMSVAQLQTMKIAHDIAMIIVLVKAYRVLLYYLKLHHISIKYIIEISIIAPAIEIIFSSGTQDLWINVLFGAFSVANLVIYLLFYERLNKIDRKECSADELADSPSLRHRP